MAEIEYTVGTLDVRERRSERTRISLKGGTPSGERTRTESTDVFAFKLTARLSLKIFKYSEDGSPSKANTSATISDASSSRVVCSDNKAIC